MASFSQKSSVMEIYQSDFVSYGNFSELGLLMDALPYFEAKDEIPPCTNCMEVISKRTRFEKHYIDPSDPGKFIIQKSYGPVHYLKNGNWEPFNFKITPKNQYILETVSSDEPMGIDFQKNQSYMKLYQGNVGFNNWKLIVIDAQNQMEKIELSANWEKGTSGKDGIYVKQIFPGIDAEITFRNGAIKTNFFIQSFEFPGYDELIFTDHFTLNGAENVLLKENSSIVEVLSNNHESLLLIEPAFGYVKSNPKYTTIDFNYQTSKNQLKLVIPAKWITDNIHQLPLVIDPLVTSSNFLAQASINGSGYNATCFNGFCSYFLTVPTPANAVLTDVQWSFNYTATGTCWLSDGAVSFFRGTCRSPGNTNFFWFCNLNSGGTCNGSNISIFNDIQTCLPAPSCAPQNVTFEMRFHRCWSAGGGCSNSCIGAASNWTMTLTGRTLEFSNASNPISVSATTICQGQSINASTSGSFGVPGYTYNWSLSPTGTPSLGNTASVNIPFPNAGTFTLYGFVTDACGNQVTSTRTITVNPSPTPSITGSTSLCQGQSTTLTASGGNTYSWNTGSTSATITINPPTTTNYTVTVTGTGGCTATLSQTVLVNPIPSPVISGTTSICNGQSTTLTASGGSSYAWNTGATTAAITVSPTSNTTYTVTVTGAGGCSATLSQTVTVNSVPTPVISGTTNICNGQSTTITASGGSSYAWNTGATTASITVSPASNTTYTVTVTGVGGCSSINSVNVTVNPSPNFSIQNNSGTTIISCNTASINVTALGAFNYIWSNGLGNNPNVSITNPGTYTVTATDANGCSSTQTITITEDTSTPLVNVINNTGTYTLDCSNTSVSITAFGGINYLWNGGSNPNSATNQFSNAGTYEVVVTGSNGCTSTASITITEDFTPPIVSIINNTGSNELSCVISSISLTATGGGSYLWSNGLGTNSSVIITNPGIYTVTVTGTNGCTSSASETILQNLNLPQVAFSASTQVGCPITCIDFTDQSTSAGSSIVSWKWSYNGIEFSTNQNPNFCFTEVGNHTISLTVTNSAGCSSTQSLPNYISILPPPIASFQLSNTLVPISNPTPNIINLSSGANTYNWNFGDGTFSSLQNPIHTYADTGNYCITLSVSSALGCSDETSGCLYVYPNFQFFIPNSFTPNGDKINDIFIYSGVGYQPISFEIFDRWGNVVYSIQDVILGWDGNHIVTGKPLPTGTYVYKIVVEDYAKKEYEFMGAVNLIR
ncbi:MAG: PKD domain-containing protein [Flavobacteriales bacterium]|nr:PKD domain-containing protein [Flavobacteriales bacterium]